MMDWAMISYDYMISPRAFQIGILIIFFSDSFWVWFGFFFSYFFSRFSPGGVQGHLGLLTKNNVGRHSNRLYHVIAHLCGVLRCQTTHANACCSHLGFWGFFLSRMLHNYRRKVLSILFALLDRVRCATCVSNSRVAPANVLRPFCLFLIFLYLEFPLLLLLLLLRDTKVNVEEGCIIRGGLRDG
jgi:hypothetical protein